MPGRIMCRLSVRLSVCLSVRPSIPVCTLTPKVFNFHVSYLVHMYRLWRQCVATYVRHLKWLPWQPGCCFPSVPVRTLTPKLFNFHISYLVYRCRLWRRCVATYVSHLKWLPWQPGCCFPCRSTILYIPSCSGIYCAHLRSCY